MLANDRVEQHRANELAKELGQERFDGDRYEFQILVESPESARGHGDRLEDVFADAITLVDSDELRALGIPEPWGFGLADRVRFGEIDALGHVNNVVVATYCEEARSHYFDAVVGMALEDLRFVVANLEVDFERPIRHGEDVVVGARATDLGRTSVTLEYEVRADGGVAATASSVQVVVDPETREPEPVPEAWREAVATREGL